MMTATPWAQWLGNATLGSRAGMFDPQLAAELANSNAARIVNAGGGKSLQQIPNGAIQSTGARTFPTAGATPKNMWNNGGAVTGAALPSSGLNQMMHPQMYEMQ